MSVLWCHIVIWALWQPCRTVLFLAINQRDTFMGTSLGDSRHVLSGFGARDDATRCRKIQADRGEVRLRVCRTGISVQLDVRSRAHAPRGLKPCNARYAIRVVLVLSYVSGKNMYQCVDHKIPQTFDFIMLYFVMIFDIINAKTVSSNWGRISCQAMWHSSYTTTTEQCPI